MSTAGSRPDQAERGWNTGKGPEVRRSRAGVVNGPAGGGRARNGREVGLASCGRA